MASGQPGTTKRIDERAAIAPTPPFETHRSAGDQGVLGQGIILDPAATAKTMSGPIDHIRTGRIGKGETVVFLHTSDEPAVFACATAAGRAKAAGLRDLGGSWRRGRRAKFSESDLGG